MSGITADELRELVLHINAAAFGGWQHDDLVAGCAELGWTVRGEPGEARLDTWLPSGAGWLRPNRWPERSPEEYASFGARLVSDVGPEEFHELVTTVSSVLEPPPWRGGPGPWVRWRGRDRTVELRLEAGAVDLSVYATGALDVEEYMRFQWGDDPPYRWCVTNELDLNHPGGQAVAGWEGYESTLAAVLGALFADVPVLGGRAYLIIETPDDTKRYVQVVVDPAAEHPAVIEASNHVLEPHRIGLTELAALGWDEPTDGNWTQSFGPGSSAAAAARSAADLLVCALLKMRVRDWRELRHRSWYTGADHLTLIGLAP